MLGNVMTTALPGAGDGTPQWLRSIDADFAWRSNAKPLAGTLPAAPTTRPAATATSRCGRAASSGRRSGRCSTRAQRHLERLELPRSR